jgi:hypothetical protein
LRQVPSMLSALRFLFAATHGYRFRPWRSPYLRWRLETYSGVKAESVDASFFFHFLWQERGQLLHFLRWTGEMREYAAPHGSQDE